MIPYLGTYENQKYLVNRLRELAQGSYLRGFRWEGGGDMLEENGRRIPWTPVLPTDSQVRTAYFSSHVDAC